MPLPGENDKPAIVSVSSRFNPLTWQPAVLIKVKDQHVVLSPAEAQDLAQTLMQAAEASISEALLFLFVSKTVKADTAVMAMNVAGMALEEFRRARKRFFTNGAIDNESD